MFPFYVCSKCYANAATQFSCAVFFFSLFSFFFFFIVPFNKFLISLLHTVSMYTTADERYCRIICYACMHKCEGGECAPGRDGITIHYSVYILCCLVERALNWITSGSIYRCRRHRRHRRRCHGSLWRYAFLIFNGFSFFFFSFVVAFSTLLPKMFFILIFLQRFNFVLHTDELDSNNCANRTVEAERWKENTNWNRYRSTMNLCDKSNLFVNFMHLNDNRPRSMQSSRGQ